MKQIKVGYKNYEIVKTEPTQTLMHGGNECYGEANHDENKIYISTKNSKEEEENTLIHEILHAIEVVFRIDLGEERVSRLADALYTVLKDNKLSVEESK